MPPPSLHLPLSLGKGYSTNRLPWSSKITPHVQPTHTKRGLSSLPCLACLAKAYTEEGSLEQTVFFTRLGQAILGASRTVYMFKSCGHCTFVRKVCIRIMSTINGGQTFNRIHGAVRQAAAVTSKTLVEFLMLCRVCRVDLANAGIGTLLRMAR